MDKELLEDIEEFINRRQDRVYSSQPHNLPSDCREGQQNADATLEELKSDLPNELKTRLILWDHRRADAEIETNSLFYSKGFRDGIKVLLSLVS